MTDVHTVPVQIAGPSESNPNGIVAYGRFIVRDNTLVLVDHKDWPIILDGRRYQQALGENDNPRRIAQRLTKKYRLARLGQSDRPTWMGKAIEYPRNYWDWVV